MIVNAGSQFPGTWQGKVHSVFANSVNLLIDAPHVPSMLTLLCNDRNMSERCLALTTEAANRLFPRLVPGMPVACCGHALEFALPDFPTLDFSHLAATPWKSPMPPALDDTERAALNKQLPGAVDFLLKMEAEMPRSSLRSAAISCFEAFVADMRETLAPNPRLLTRLVGAGPGLTPSGDDLLVGLCCALHGMRHPLFIALQAQLPALLSNTTFVSRAMLEDAMQGSFHRPLAELRLALMTRKSQMEIRKALQRAAEFGASSGCDGTRGLLLGLQSFQNSVSLSGQQPDIQPVAPFQVDR